MEGKAVKVQDIENKSVIPPSDNTSNEKKLLDVYADS